MIRKKIKSFSVVAFAPLHVSLLCASLLFVSSKSFAMNNGINDGVRVNDILEDSASREAIIQEAQLNNLQNVTRAYVENYFRGENYFRDFDELTIESEDPEELSQRAYDTDDEARVVADQLREVQGNNFLDFRDYVEDNLQDFDEVAVENDGTQELSRQSHETNNEGLGGPVDNVTVNTTPENPDKTVIGKLVSDVIEKLEKVFWEPTAKKDIKKFVLGVVNNVEKKVEDENLCCSICLEPIKDSNENVIELKCRGKHKFHENCINDWYNSGGGTCPNCREQVIN